MNNTERDTYIYECMYMCMLHLQLPKLEPESCPRFPLSPHPSCLQINLFLYICPFLAINLAFSLFKWQFISYLIVLPFFQYLSTSLAPSLPQCCYRSCSNNRICSYNFLNIKCFKFGLLNLAHRLVYNPAFVCLTSLSPHGRHAVSQLSSFTLAFLSACNTVPTLHQYQAFKIHYR